MKTDQTTSPFFSIFYQIWHEKSIILWFWYFIFSVIIISAHHFLLKQSKSSNFVLFNYLFPFSPKRRKTKRGATAANHKKFGEFKAKWLMKNENEIYNSNIKIHLQKCGEWKKKQKKRKQRVQGSAIYSSFSSLLQNIFSIIIIIVYERHLQRERKMCAQVPVHWCLGSEFRFDDSQTWFSLSCLFRNNYMHLAIALCL